ncbi:hypothetical protein BDV95DRAFT_595036 [Massariosphaeria phaeospora]|uniref:Uncharacterized protein n=1 Tax=Massariosphaeria phaeospora TaxID=100035 RepID=A0A7C8I589_9PLEO|nr:hypothetical protein BDV95DRAFT_595036 [Massariosphaeria phaeospora]
MHPLRWDFPPASGSNPPREINVEKVDLDDSIAKYIRAAVTSSHPNQGFGSKPVYRNDTIDLRGTAQGPHTQDAENVQRIHWCLTCTEKYAGAKVWDACNNFKMGPSTSIWKNSFEMKEKDEHVMNPLPEGVSAAICTFGTTDTGPFNLTTAFPFLNTDRPDGKSFLFSQAEAEGAEIVEAVTTTPATIMNPNQKSNVQFPGPMPIPASRTPSKPQYNGTYAWHFVGPAMEGAIVILLMFIVLRSAFYTKRPHTIYDYMKEAASKHHHHSRNATPISISNSIPIHVPITGLSRAERDFVTRLKNGNETPPPTYNAAMGDISRPGKRDSLMTVNIALETPSRSSTDSTRARVWLAAAKNFPRGGRRSRVFATAKPEARRSKLFHALSHNRKWSGSVSSFKWGGGNDKEKRSTIRMSTLSVSKHQRLASKVSSHFRAWSRGSIAGSSLRHEVRASTLDGLMDGHQQVPSPAATQHSFPHTPTHNRFPSTLTAHSMQLFPPPSPSQYSLSEHQRPASTLSQQLFPHTPIHNRFPSTLTAHSMQLFPPPTSTQNSSSHRRIASNLSHQFFPHESPRDDRFAHPAPSPLSREMRGSFQFPFQGPMTGPGPAVYDVEAQTFAGPSRNTRWSFNPPQ